MATRSYTDARKRANQKWNDANKEKTYHYQKKSRAKSYIKNDLSLSEIEEFRSLIDERERILKEEK